MLAFQQFVFLAEVDGFDVAYAEAGSGDFVGVGRTYAFKGGADFSVAFGLFVGSIEHAVSGQYKVGFLRNIKVLSCINVLFEEGFNFVFEDIGLNQNTIANDVEFVFVKYA